MNKNSQFHWGEANKYGVEFAKSQIAVNSAITIAIIAYSAQTKDVSLSLLFSASSFLLAVVLCFCFLSLAWFACMNYGNSCADKIVDDKIWDRGNYLARCAWFIAVLAVVAFLSGFLLLAHHVFISTLK